MIDYKEFLALAPISLKPVIENLHNIIMLSSKKVQLEIKWGSLTYSINDLICSINIHRDHINLQFFYGAQFDDENVLDGSEKNLRHMKFKHKEEIKKTLVRKDVKKAIGYDKRFKREY